MSFATEPTTATPAPSAFPPDWSVADLEKHFGVATHRIRVFPPLGTASESDVCRIQEQEGRLFELENGVLVEKVIGWYESILATFIVRRIGSYLDEHDLGQVLGADGSVKILPGIIKIPDVSFICWARFPKQKLPRRPIPMLIPDLVVEILSEGNTTIEMNAKLISYFEADVRLVWYIDPATRTAKCYTTPSEMQSIASDGELDGGSVLPGLRISLAKLFEQADRQGPQSS